MTKNRQNSAQELKLEWDGPQSLIIEVSVIIFFLDDDHLDSYPRILCWILTDPKDLYPATASVRDTWIKRCNISLFISSASNLSFPTLGVSVPPGRSHLATKSRLAWTHIFTHYIHQADYFLKADSDTYVVVENLRSYLRGRDCGRPEMFGHAFHLDKLPVDQYVSGGAGIVLSREAVIRLVTKAFLVNTSCIPDGAGEL